MKSERMEMQIYQEYKENIEKGRYKGLEILEELQKGEYLTHLKCRESEPELFQKVSMKVKRDMEEGFLSQIDKVPFFVRNKVLHAKYGAVIYGVDIDNKILSSVNKKLRELKETLENSKSDNSRLYETLNHMKGNRKSGTLEMN